MSRSRLARAVSARRFWSNADPAASEDGPLAGVRVVDLSRILAGPLCTQMMGDLGAEVIKIEKPDGGDDTRQWGPPYAPGGDSTYFMALNRNKRSVVIDLKKSVGVDLVRELVQHADVLVENFIPGTMERYGLGYEALARLNPRLVFTSITGFGPDGPYAHKLGYDLIASAYGGLLAITGEEGGGPVKPGVALTDVSTGIYAHSAICAALFARHRTGRGQRIDASLFESQLANLVNAATAYLIGGVETQRRGTAHESIVPYQAFRTRDGEVLAGVGNAKQWARFCAALDAPELLSDRRFASNESRVEHRRELGPLLERKFVLRSTAEWVETLSRHKLPNAPVNNMQQVFSDPHALHRGMLQHIAHPVAGRLSLVGFPVKYSDTKPSLRRPPPVLGQHTDEVLRQMNLSAERIQQLRADGVVA